ncbi:MAG: uracil-DNA glycosylase [Bacteroidia bacterium]|nr:uracil-DNA glycosylase [Bacteroidia bacterium]
MSVKIDPSWHEALASEWEQPYFKNLKAFLVREREEGHTVYPPGSLIFNAFNKTPFDRVKVVILGQDPYHGPGQAHGLSFSVPAGIKPPPSLVNLYKELASDTGFRIPAHGNLEPWAERGVLLLNSMLTVRANTPGSHARQGWETFTDAVIRALNIGREGLVFLLWGKYAQDKGQIIDRNRHHVLLAAHPSPFSADKGFFGCRHFSKANELLAARGAEPVDWQL